MRHLFSKTLIIILLIAVACDNKKSDMESPLTTVIKLKSAESDANFEVAKKYIDVEKVFSKYPESKNPEKEWKEQVNFWFNLSQSKKFTNRFRYYNYEISEQVQGKEAIVTLKAFDSNDPIQQYVYSLDLINESWIVTGIEYIKK